MAAKRKSAKKTEIQEVAVNEQPIGPDLNPDPEIEIPTNVVPTPAELEEIVAKKQKTKKQKFSIGDIVFISKDADADLNGFKLFPQYKKYTYTVEAYEPDTDVYTLRKLNFTLRLKGDLILAPDERAHDSINRRRF